MIITILVCSIISTLGVMSIALFFFFLCKDNSKKQKSLTNYSNLEIETELEKRKSIV